MKSVRTVLIVDDSELDRRLIAGLLRNNQRSLRIEFAQNGQDALDRMIWSLPDLVITDLNMPIMDGRVLVRTVRRDYPQVPVILLTAYGNEAIAVEALESGAASYVPKALQAERLAETVERVLTRLDADRVRQKLVSCVVELNARFSLQNDPQLVALLVDQVQQTLCAMDLGDAAERIRVCVALEEALLNALYHGNLELDPDDLRGARSAARRDGLLNLIRKRRGDPLRRGRTIDVEVHIAPELAQFVIRDQGRGFDAEASSHNRLDEYFERGENRGTMLMRSFVDQVSYNAAGNEVTLMHLGGTRGAHQLATTVAVG
jgi:CheY-like chemotaxis protein